MIITFNPLAQAFHCVIPLWGGATPSQINSPGSIQMEPLPLKSTSSGAYRTRAAISWFPSLKLKLLLPTNISTEFLSWAHSCTVIIWIQIQGEFQHLQNFTHFFVKCQESRKLHVLVTNMRELMVNVSGIVLGAPTQSYRSYISMVIKWHSMFTSVQMIHWCSSHNW